MKTRAGARRGQVWGVAAIVLTIAAGCGPVGSVATPAPFPLPGGAHDRPRPAAAPAPPGPPTVAAPIPAEMTAQILGTALGLRGIAYRLGGDDPVSGFDCSGFVHYVFGQHQLEVPRTVVEQFAAGEDVAPDRIRAGDLVFFSTIGPGPTHVGIALGPGAPGEFVHAPGTGSAVRIERFDTPYWRARWLGAKRPALTRR